MSREILRSAIVASLLAAGGYTVTTHSAETEGHALANLKEPIPSQPVAGALSAFKRQTGLQVVYVSAVADGLNSTAVPGGVSPSEALRQLLHSTGLSFEFLDERTVTIVSAERSVPTRQATSATLEAPERLRLAQAEPGASQPKVADAAAQTPAASLALEEIVVSATRRDESVRDIPQSITALDGAYLAQAGVRGLQDYIASVPSLSAVDRGSGRTKIVMRGVSTGPARFDDAQSRETTGYYIDESPVAIAAYNPDLFMIDVARVEVLRGPQPTLYGAGSMSGTLRLITAEPVFDEWSGTLSAEIGSTEDGDLNHSVSSVANIPVVEGRSALRLAAYNDFEDGYIDNARLGNDNVNAARKRGVRAVNRTELTDDVSAKLMLWWQDIRVDEEDIELQNGDSAFPSAVPEGLQINRYLGQPGRDKFLLGALTLDAAIGRGTLTSATTVLDRSFDYRSDYTLGIIRNLGVTNLATIEDATDVRAYVQEIRYVTDKSEPWRWTIGASFSDESRAYDQDVPSPGIDALIGLDTGQFGEAENLFQGHSQIDVQQFAVFGEAEYAFTERLVASVGARAFRAETDTDIMFQGFFQGGRDRNVGRAKEDGINPKGSLLFKITDDVSLYGSAARGFRLGGTNQAIPLTIPQCVTDLAALGRSSAPTSFESDKLWNYEVGAKMQTPGHRLSVNASLFHIDWDGIQLTTPLSGACGFAFTANVGTARSRGAEVDLQARPVPGLTLGLSGSYVDAELTATVPGLSFARPGARLPAVPRYNASASARYEHQLLSNATAFLFGSVRHVGSSYVNFLERPVDFIDAYTLVDARAGIELERVDVTLSVYNVFNELPVFFRENVRGEVLADIGRPRTVALGVNYRF
jgi:iron complex outermembrane recepter protein